MESLKAEVDAVRAHGFELEFDYPTQEEIAKLARVNRDMTEQERRQWQGKFSALEEVMRAVDDGEVPIEALPKSIRDRFADDRDDRGRGKNGG